MIFLYQNILYTENNMVLQHDMYRESESEMSNGNEENIEIDFIKCNIVIGSNILKIKIH